MQKLYRVAFQKLAKKMGVDKPDLNLQSLKLLLQQKKMPVTDSSIFHRLPREQIKNMIRNPCCINNVQQLSSEIITISKQLRGHLNITQKKVCVRCPFVQKCPHAFIQAKQPAAKVENALQKLLLNMKYISQLESQKIIKQRSLFSGVRACDSLGTISQELEKTPEDYQMFRKEREVYVDVQVKEDQEYKIANNIGVKQVIKNAKKQRIPLKDVYAQIPASQIKQGSTQVSEQAIQALKKKKSSLQFIKMSQKYINQQNSSPEQQTQPKKYPKKYQSSQQQSNNQRKPRQNRQPRQYSNNKYQGKKQYNNYNKGGDRQFDRGQRDQKFQGKRDYNNKDQGQRRPPRQYEERGPRQNGYEAKPYNKYENKPRYNQRDDGDKPRYNQRDNESKPRYNQRDNEDRPRYNQRDNEDKPRYNQRQNQDQNPRINRLSKQRPDRREFTQKPREQSAQKSKFYQKFDSSEQSFQAPYQVKRARQPRQPFSQDEMTQFSKLQKIPKILKTEYATTSDVNQRQQVNQERKQRPGRRIKR